MLANFSAMDAVTPKDVRQAVSYDPSPWAEYFLHYVPDEVTHAKMEEEAKKLEKEVKTKLKQLLTRADKKMELINYIDIIERLGVTYRLEEEVEEAVQIVHDQFKEADMDELDLFHTSLLFRLLRQHGFYVSCDVFSKFQDDNGRFKDFLASDVKGLLSLYQASFLGKHEDYVMDEARVFATGHMKLVEVNLDHPLASQVSHALYQSLHRGMTRLESRIFISFYEEVQSHDSILLKLAKLDYNMVQALHKKELRDLTRWWKESNPVAKMQVCYRDRMVESYFWAVGQFYEPQYSVGRKIFAQWFVLTTVIDDIYDTHGTFEEVTMFTEAVERWDKSWVNKLPQYMQLCYKFLLEIFEKFEEDLALLGRSRFIKYAREEMINLCRVYYQEAKWCNEKYTPTFEEYMEKASIVSSGCCLMVTLSYLVIEEANKEAFEWVAQKPQFVVDASIIIRLMDDIASHEFEQERDHVSSAVEIYMRQYKVTEEEALEELEKKLTYCWKDLNEMMIMPWIMPKPLLSTILNKCRMMDVAYGKGEDSYTFPYKSMKNNISLVLVDPIPLI